MHIHDPASHNFFFANTTRRKISATNEQSEEKKNKNEEKIQQIFQVPINVNNVNNINNMSHEGQEELLDYSDSEEIAVPSAVTTGEGETNDKEADKKGSYVGIHATGFRDFLLKPELLRAIGDCGFEHPSEGMYINLINLP